VLDLRRDDERIERPSALGDLPVSVVHISISSGAPADFTEIPDLDTVYREMVRCSGPALAAAVTALAEPEALPAIVHCTAGKDRTGLVVAFVLVLLGVDDDTVIADYSASASLLGHAFADRLAGVDAEALERLAPLLGSPPELISAVLAEIRDTHGDVERFLVHHGMSEDVPGRLRRALVEP
jgi:protein-tyrosine phosphatase